MVVDPQSNLGDTYPMKKMSLAIAILAMSAGNAFSADLAARPYTKAPPMVAAIYDWSGFYVGINGGGGSARNTCWDLLIPAALGGIIPQGCHNSTGGTVGGQLGYRWQSANWVFGVEGQGNWAEFKGDNVSLLIPGNRNRTKIDAFGLFTGQIGYAWNNVLLYVKGCAAVVSNKYDVLAAGAVFASANETRWGGTVGAGFEVGFAPNWSVGIEYDHIFLNDRNVTLVAAAGGIAGTDRIRQDVDIGLVRVNYRFGGPVIAKY